MPLGCRVGRYAACRAGTPEVIAAAAGGRRDIEALHHVREVTMGEEPSGSVPEHPPRSSPPAGDTAVAVPGLAGFTGAAPAGGGPRVTPPGR